MNTDNYTEINAISEKGKIMSNTDTVSLFDDATATPATDTSDAATAVPTVVATAPDSSATDAPTDGAVGSEGGAAPETETQEILDTRPDGVMTAGDFAQHLTFLLMEKSFKEGTPFSPSDYIIAQSIYQAMARKSDPLPHVLVAQGEGKDPQRLVKVAEGVEWWLNRPAGGSSGPGASKDPEKEAALLAEAYRKFLWAEFRAIQWDARRNKANNLVVKRTGWLATLGGDPEAIKTAAKAEFDTSQAAKSAKSEEAEENGTSIPDSE